jgi:predicted Zn-dependent protease
MWSRYRTEALALGASLLLAACGSVPTAPEPAPAEPAPDTTVPRGESTGTAVDPAGTTAPPARAPGAAPTVVEVPERAAADFGRAVATMQSGFAEEAELEFKRLAGAYPQLAGPHVNLGILHRKAGRLDPAVESLRAAVERNPASAVAWNELGVTLRMRGNFQDAQAAYERAIAADPAFAPAHRNLGVLRDLYLGDAPGALEALLQYQALTGEERPVTGWIAELRQRTGIKQPAPPPPAAESAPPENPPPQSGEGAVS